MELNFGGVSVRKIAEKERCSKKVYVKRELPIFTRLKLSKAEIIIFRFTMEVKHFVAKFVDKSYIVLFKKFDITVNALVKPKDFFFLKEFIPTVKIIKSQKMIIGILFYYSIIFSNVSRRYWVALKMYIPFVFIAIHIK